MSTIEVEGPNHAGWEQFRAVMESLAETMDDGPMVTNEQGVDFLAALSERGYQISPAGLNIADYRRMRAVLMDLAGEQWCPTTKGGTEGKWCLTHDDQPMVDDLRCAMMQRVWETLAQVEP